MVEAIGWGLSVCDSGGTGASWGNMSASRIILCECAFRIAANGKDGGCLMVLMDGMGCIDVREVADQSLWYLASLAVKR
jgi:hypothetical protein